MLSPHLHREEISAVLRETTFATSLQNCALLYYTTGVESMQAGSIATNASYTLYITKLRLENKTEHNFI